MSLSSSSTKRRQLIPALLAVIGLLVGVADVWLNRALEPLRHTNGQAVQQAFPQTARLDLLVLVALVVLVVAVVVHERSDADEPDGDRARVAWVLAVVLGMAGGVLLSPTAGLLVPFAFLAVGWIGPRLTDGPRRQRSACWPRL
jgi:hypothetical protein